MQIPKLLHLHRHFFSKIYSLRLQSPVIYSLTSCSPHQKRPMPKHQPLYLAIFPKRLATATSRTYA